ncbi:hypothetical protein [Jiella sonneratiae]|uniref:Transposase n=1 Tax=Jiella sonneratiae TaxID=2816856 RepID=A0ABS3JCP5_9HYPH|nr:hypothetical protein [Jiella sonneratiae]MBO0906341.1 hypothetical protein [Jiella sonneratiae]
MEAEIATFRPKSLFATITAMFRSAWGQRLKQADTMKTALRHEAAKLDREIGQLLDRVVEATNTTVIATYERRIAKLEKDKLITAEKLARSGKPQRPFDEMFELALGFPSNPRKLWASGEITLQKTVLRLAFADRLAVSIRPGPRRSVDPVLALGEGCFATVRRRASLATRFRISSRSMVRGSNAPPDQSSR